MPTYNLSCAVTVSAYTTVEADSLEAAIEEAMGRPVELHFNGSGTSADEVWCVEEADGTPEGVTGEEA
jgi:hypothetical protein